MLFFSFFLGFIRAALALDYQNKVRLEFADEIKAAMGKKHGKIKFYINGISTTVGAQTHAEVECLTSDPFWGYDYFDSMAAYTRTMYEDRLYMSGRFQNEWGDFGGIKTFASMQNVPLRIYSASMSAGEMQRAIVLQVFWLIALVLLGKALCCMAMRRMTLQGG